MFPNILFAGHTYPSDKAVNTLDATLRWTHLGIYNIGLSDTSLKPSFISEYFPRISCVLGWPIFICIVYLSQTAFLVISVYFRSTTPKKRQNGKRVVFCSVPWSGPCWPILLIHVPKCLGDNGLSCLYVQHCNSLICLFGISTKVKKHGRNRQPRNS